MTSGAFHWLRPRKKNVVIGRSCQLSGRACQRANRVICWNTRADFTSQKHRWHQSPNSYFGSAEETDLICEGTRSGQASSTDWHLDFRTILKTFTNWFHIRFSSQPGSPKISDMNSPNITTLQSWRKSQNLLTCYHGNHSQKPACDLRPQRAVCDILFNYYFLLSLIFKKNLFLTCLRRHLHFVHRFNAALRSEMTNRDEHRNHNTIPLTSSHANKNRKWTFTLHFNLFIYFKVISSASQQTLTFLLPVKFLTRGPYYATSCWSCDL